MRRLLISRVYLMKCLGFVLLFGFISLGAIGGCNNNGGGQDGTQALTENDFAEDPGLSANPKKDVVVTFLEHPDSEEPGNDTGEIGNDVIPFKYKSTLEHTFCWEDDDPDAEHFMVLEDSDGNEIFLLDVNGECITVVLEAGDYVMIIHHDGRIETTHPIFIIPSNEDGVQADTGTDGLIKNGKVLISNILQNLHNTITQNAKAQKKPKKNKKTTLLKTDACPNCNLTGAKLKNAKLSGADLSGADLTDADLTKADLSGADLSGAILTGVILGDTMFTSALWCDSLCTCGANSIDTCVGCASIDICTALNRCELDCDDGSVCTSDICDPTTLLCTHEPVDCDDGIACTVDSCDPAEGCQTTPDPTACPAPDNECLVAECIEGFGCGPPETRPDGTQCDLMGVEGACHSGICQSPEKCFCSCLGILDDPPPDLDATCTLTFTGIQQSVDACQGGYNLCIESCRAGQGGVGPPGCEEADDCIGEFFECLDTEQCGSKVAKCIEIIEQQIAEIEIEFIEFCTSQLIALEIQLTVLSFEACVFSDECFDVIPNPSTCPQDVVDAAQPGCAGLFGMDAIDNILDILGGKTGPPVPADDFCAQITE